MLEIEWKDNMEVISLGGGIQSSTMLLMNILGEIEPKAEFAIFADTGWERQATYNQILWLNAKCLEYGFPEIWIVSSGNIRDNTLNPQNYEDMPLYTVSNKRTGQLSFSGEEIVKTSRGQLRRQCTRHYKIKVINREIRKKYGMKKRKQWIGFSVDEVVRMRPSRVKYIEHRFPLIEMRMSRQDCIDWLNSHGYPIPEKSACIGCPYRSDAEWRSLTPKEMEDAIDFDEKIRGKHMLNPKRKDFPLFLHHSCKPLKDVSFSEDDSDIQKQEGCDGGCWL